MFVCPDCKGPLNELACATCGVQFGTSEGIPELLSRDARFAQAPQISSTYDDIYSRRTQVWEDQGRTPEFLRYFSGLVGELPAGRLLEVGCGEGYLLSSFKVGDKFAVDISATAAAKAGARAQAKTSVALAERLPFADSTFDVVASVGVMEHFLDDRAATAEIRRVLKPGGRYIALIHVQRSTGQKVAQKLREYFFPPRPLKLLRWMRGKIYRPIQQPVQIGYTIASGQECLEHSGLRIERLIHLGTDPSAPLVGPHVVIYIARK